jgi:hypothetical protein
MKRNMILMTLLSFMLTALYAQPGENRQCAGQHNPELRQFAVEHILPMVKEQRQLFDGVMSTEDKTEIERLRSAVKELHKTRNEKWQMHRNAGQRMPAEQRQEMRKMRLQMQELIDETAFIADKYQDELTPILSDLRHNITTEKDNYCPGRPAYNQERRMRRNAPKVGSGGFGMKEGNGFHFRRILTPVGFLLFDPNTIQVKMDNLNPEKDHLKVNLFPNPASDHVQVSLMLEERQNVSLQLLDRDGNVMRIISEQTENAGMFTATIQLDNLPDGMYFVKVTAGNKTATQRMIVRK